MASEALKQKGEQRNKVQRIEPKDASRVGRSSKTSLRDLAQLRGVKNWAPGPAHQAHN